MGKKKEKGLITKGRYELKFRGTECLNCGHILDVSDKYCPNCSQANSTKKLVLKDFFDEFFSSLINYDSKLLTTLYIMLRKPGSISKDYIRGKRIAYTNPFRFLLSLAFLYFLMVTYGSNFNRWDDEWKLDEKIENQGDFNFSFDNGNDFKDSTKVKNYQGFNMGDLDSLKAANPEVAQDLKPLDSLGSFINRGIVQEKRKDSLMLGNPKKFYADMKANNKDGFANKMEFFFELLRKDSIASFEDATKKFEVDESRHTKMAFNASKSGLRALAQPGSWLNATMAKLPFVIFFFLPVFTVFIFLAYIRKKYTYTDHLIFSFHSQSLLFILLILSWLIDTFFGWSTIGFAFWAFAIYLFLAMRKFYGQGFFKTIIKYFFLNTVFTILALFAILLLSVGSVFTY